MKSFAVYLLLLVALYACHSAPAGETNSKSITKDTSSVTEDTGGQYANYFVVIADTGKSYYSLRKEMFQLSKSAILTIDTMGRLYNKTKDLIALPDDDSDEIYRGEYYPRRYASQNISLEYLEQYDKSGKKTIALVAGIYEKKASADSLVQILKPLSKKVYSVEARLYEGCMH